MSSTRKHPNNNVSNNNIIIKYDLMFPFMEFQLLNNAIGVIIVVNNTKYIDNPSNPKYKSKELILWYSWTNWNWLVLKSNNIKITKERKRLIIDVVKAIVFIRFICKRDKS